MRFSPLDIPGLALITPRRFGDARGWFAETWSAQRMAEAGHDMAFLQDNHAFSRDSGTLRGLHYQAPPFAQTKLVRCVRGRIFDVAVDIRLGSPFYGAWRGVRLDAETGDQILVPKGFLHGYLTLTPDAEVEYKVDAPYAPECDRAVRWSDPALGIEWPLAEAGVATPILSAKDADAPALAASPSPFRFAEASG